MTFSELKKLIPLLKANNVASFKKSKEGIELYFNSPHYNQTQDVIEKAPFTYPGMPKLDKDPKQLDLPLTESVKIVRSGDAQIPTTSLEEEPGMEYDKILFHSASPGNEMSVSGVSGEPLTSENTVDNGN